MVDIHDPHAQAILDAELVQASKKAVMAVLTRVRHEQAVHDLLGPGTEAFDLLTAAAAIMFNDNVATIRRMYGTVVAQTDPGAG